MITNNFPLKQKVELDRQCQQEITAITNQRNQNVNQIKQRYNTSYDGSSYIGMGVIAGAVISIFQCTMIYQDVDPAFFNLVLYSAIGGVIGAILAMGAKKTVEDNKRIIANQTRNQDYSLQTNRTQIQNKYNAQYQSYLNEFNQNARSKSTYFSSQPVTVEVTTWLTNHFCNCINGVDKNSYARVIAIPFKFTIDNDRVLAYTIRDSREICLGEYRFSMYRFSSLPNDLDKAALAIALSSMVRFNVMRRYPKDKNGGIVNVSVEQTYTAYSTVTNMTYSAY